MIGITSIIYSNRTFQETVQFKVFENGGIDNFALDYVGILREKKFLKKKTRSVTIFRHAFFYKRNKIVPTICFSNCRKEYLSVNSHGIGINHIINIILSVSRGIMLHIIVY